MLSRSKIDRLVAITISVNYSDMFKHCVKHGMDHIDEWTVVSDTKDSGISDICNKHDNMKLIRSDCFYENGASFNKGKAINLGLKEVDLSGHTWILLLDADIILPDNFRETLSERKFGLYTLYGVPRYFALKYTQYEAFLKDRDYKIFSKYQRFRQQPIGYFQLFNSLNLKLEAFEDGTPFPENGTHAAYSDTVFLRKFRNRRDIPSMPVVHLGDSGKNWRGRTTPEFA